MRFGKNKGHKHNYSDKNKRHKKRFKVVNSNHVIVKAP